MPKTRDGVRELLTFSTSCDSSPPPSILTTGFPEIGGSGSSLVCFGAGSILVKEAAIEVISVYFAEVRVDIENKVLANFTRKLATAFIVAPRSHRLYCSQTT